MGKYNTQSKLHAYYGTCRTLSANDNTDLTYVQKELPLYQYLLDPTRYNPDLMPITNSTKPLHSNVDLKYSLELIQLVDIVSTLKYTL